MDIEIFYMRMFLLTYHGKYSINDIESLYPYEMDIYIMLLEKHLEELQNAQTE